MPSSYSLSRVGKFLALPPSVQWRAYVVRLPWLVPLPVLRFTSPDGPYPTILQLPSRGPHHIPCYLFFPPDRDFKSAPSLPIHLDFHGGGFIMGSCLEQAPFCALLARTTGRLVISVDYRKGPIDKFPAAIEDGEDVLAAVLDSGSTTQAGKLLRDAVSKHYSAGASPHEQPQFDHTNISLSGFSSGGNLALNLLLSVETEQEGKWPSLFAKEGKPIPALLFYPSLDCRQLPHERPRPEKLKAREADSSTWFPNLGSVLGPTYLPPHARTHARASPGLNNMRECLSQRSRIRLILPEVDTLADQSEVWVRKMRDEGWPDGQEDGRFVVVREEDMSHGWTQFPDVALGERERERKVAVLREAAEWVRDIGHSTGPAEQ